MTMSEAKEAEGLTARLEALRNFVADVDGPIYQRETNIKTVNMAIDALRSLDARRSAIGAQITVPREPTDAMVQAGIDYAIGPSLEGTPGIYKAMLAAAPAASPQQEPVKEAWKAMQSLRDFIVTRQKGVVFQAEQDAWDEVGKFVNAEIRRLIDQYHAAPQSVPTEERTTDDLPPQYVVRAGDNHFHTWLCTTPEDVHNAIAEAMFGSVKDATDDHKEEWDHLIEWFENPAEWDENSGREISMNFEDGSLQVIALRSGMNVDRK